MLDKIITISALSTSDDDLLITTLLTYFYDSVSNEIKPPDIFRHKTTFYQWIGHQDPWMGIKTRARVFGKESSLSMRRTRAISWAKVTHAS